MLGFIFVVMRYIRSSLKCLFIVSAVMVSALMGSALSYADDCLVRTDSRALMSGHPELQQEQLSTETGSYAALLKNGDSVLARFDSCGLGLQAHYLVTRQLSDEEFFSSLEDFVSAVLPSEIVRNKVLPQLKNYKTNDLFAGIELDGLGDRHALLIKTFSFGGVRSEIHYRWIPPEL